MNIREIAEKAGVSVATVSRVLNHPESVAASTREKVEAIIRDAEYTPNWFAQGLNFDKTKTMGLMVTNLLDNASMEVARGVEDVAHQKAYTTLICNAESDVEKEREYLHLLVQRRVDGIVMIHPSLTEEDFKYLEENKVPSVIIGENNRVRGTHTININSTNAAYMVAKHFDGIGYRDVGMIIGDKPEIENRNKLRGFSDGCKYFNISFKKENMQIAPNTIEGGYMATKKLVESGNLPEAIFATSDILAFGCIDCFHDFDINVPENVGVVGFDNIRMSNLITPKLTTIEKPMHKMGVMGARLLIDFIDGEEDAFSGKSHDITLLAKLRIRKSCGHKYRIGEMF